MAQICLSIDDDVKQEAEQVCEDMGMSMSTAVNIYLKRLGRERRIPFEVMAEPVSSSENTAILDRRIADIRAGRNVSEHELIEV
ncbi:type II toxin-antitoxin system RelB/DinJ family antitoxin [Selenomonas sputigena]|jgi:addiction module antitoxin, relB/dinJ family|uniref:Addiction module antitoxin, RelB/DinJ family n=1 Tax=Selenomonas sputigena (strain ATCC 35185 / DSM 20758 / CCUG 44933 / VPI D19B-28) TaxID=546271 RepID=C9LUC4_SELS3|nr:type II toxin-antitoxin system RelB/DinJ family antitoxin [Selenomonas sputigena]AEC00252.1 addiction module antitoxin, RelB/DinJ family [Selenomonas sputigena ATCC 35185]EEX77655.1 addiction module antitoxin, RelB/DinJ family [Selenomonas sputigena ATCC 35185]